MLKKYGVFIILMVIFLSVICIFLIYENNKNIKIKFNEEQLKIYEENLSKLKLAQEEYEKSLKIVEEEKRFPSSYVASVPIFMYHFIRDEVGDYQYPENMVKVNTLKEQLKYIKENLFEPIYISDLNKIYKFKKPIALTFDDGWEDFYINAFPLIKEYNIKVTLFVVDKFFTMSGYCNLNQLKELKESGLVDIQAHSMTHPYLSTLSEEKINYEVVEIKKMLKDKLNIESKIFCYPYGDRNNIVLSKVKENYEYALDMDGGVYYTNKFDKHKIPRIYANRSMTLNTFISYLNKSDVKVEW